MAKFYSVQVGEVTKETPDSVSFTIVPKPEDAAAFAFVAGQYLTFKIHLDGQEIRRSYSICSSPLEGEIRVGVKRVDGGLFSTWANRVLQPGMTLEAMPPMGHFTTSIASGSNKHYAAVAAGSGITPILSIIKTVLAADPTAQFSLFYGNRSTPFIMFREVLENLKNTYTGRFALYHILSRESIDLPLFNGRITSERCQSWFSTLLPVDWVDEWFLCGPMEMTQSVQAVLEEKGVAKQAIHVELFTAPGQPTTTKTSMAAQKEFEGAKSLVHVKLDGLTTAFELETDGLNILDAALDAGADVPYACKGAVCCTCKARVTEGKVAMEMNYALTQDEVEAGFVLTCQAHPLTASVVVDFDQA